MRTRKKLKLIEYPIEISGRYIGRLEFCRHATLSDYKFWVFVAWFALSLCVLLAWLLVMESKYHFIEKSQAS